MRQKFIEGEEYQELLFGNWEADYKETKLPEDNYKFSIFVSMEQEANLRTYLGVDTIASLNSKPKIAIADTLLTKVFTGLSSARAKEIAAAINKYSNEYKINDTVKMSHFLGQIGFESNGFKAKIEGCSYPSPTKLAKSKDNLRKWAFVTRKKIADRKVIGKRTFLPLKNPDLFKGFNEDNKYFLLGKHNGENWTGLEKHIYILSADFKRITDSLDADTKYDKRRGFKAKYAKINTNPCDLLNYVYRHRMGNGDVKSEEGSYYSGKGYIQLTGKNQYTKVYKKWKHTENGKGKTMKEMATLITTDVETAMLVSFIYWDINNLNQYVVKGKITDGSCKKIGGSINKGSPKKKPLEHDKRVEKTKEIHKAL